MNEQKTRVQAALSDLKTACHPAMIPWVVELQKELDLELDTLRQRLAEVEADNERLRGAFDDADETASVHWYGEWVTAKRRAEQAESKLALAGQDARRLDWLEAHPNELRFEPFSRSGLAWACCPSTKIGNDGRPHSDVDRFATARAAIDAAIARQGEGHE